MAFNHILVVDDDAKIRDLLGDYLRKNGYQVTPIDLSVHYYSAR